LKACDCITASVYDWSDKSRIQTQLTNIWKAIVCGGRDFSDRKMVFAVLDKLDVGHVIEGGAKGADSLAREWAIARCRPFTEYTANWAEHGRGAGPRRNAEMLTEQFIDAVVAFPGGRGTDHMRALAGGQGLPVIDAHSLLASA
jgi:hypothetical protein